MLSDYYQTLELYRKGESTFDSRGGWASVTTFKGLIQVPRNNDGMSNGKNTSIVDGILFCELELNEEIQVGDRVGNGDLWYIVSGRKSQPLGVTGIAAHRGNHCEFTLEYDSVGR